MSVVSDSVQPHRQQPNRLLCPWDSPGRSTGVGCRFLLQRMTVKLFSHVQLLATPWTVAYQAPPSIGFSRQEYWSGLPLPSPRVSIGPGNSTSRYIPTPPPRIENRCSNKNFSTGVHSSIIHSIIPPKGENNSNVYQLMIWVNKI